jgi:hypothetical protein
MLRVRVSRHIARLVVDNFASRGSSSTTSPHPAHRRQLRLTQLVVDYFAYVARPGALARRAARP